MSKRLSPKALERAIVAHAAVRANNGSLSAGWDRARIEAEGWFGFRSRGSQPVIAYSYHRKRIHWHSCLGYSS